MSDGYLDNLLPDFGEYSLDPVLESYRSRTASPASEQPPEPEQSARAAEAIAQRSRQIVMQALGETLSQHRKIPDADFQSDELDELIDQVAGAVASKKAPEEQPPEPKKPRVHVSPDGVITMDIELPQQEQDEPEDEPDWELEDELDEEDLDEEEPEEDEEPASGRRGPGRWKRPGRGRGQRQSQDQPQSAAPEQKPRFRDRLLAPLDRLAATSRVRRELQSKEAANWPEPEQYLETEELPPKKAAKFYGQQLRPLRFRLRACVFLCIVLTWICLGLPMAGLLGRSLRVQSGVSLVLLLTVMLAALDILATGLRQLFDLHPGAEALAALAALMSAVDAAMVMVGYGRYLPFCAVGAFSLTAALWGEKLDCQARARTLRAAAASSRPAAVTAEQTSHGGKYICRSQRPVEGIVRQCEQADMCRTVYGTAAPILLLASLALAILASLNGLGAYFLHTLSALLCVSASFTAFLCFPLPYCLTAGKLQNAGAAIIGYAGAASIGKSRRLVIFDEDLFPPGTIMFTEINIVDSVPAQRVISSTASLLAASGSGVISVFMELMERRKYPLLQLEEFRCHEGGGLSARVDGEQVLVGSAGFMNLMGIRIPQNMFLQNAVCTAMSGELVAVFNLKYTPKKFVKGALATLLQGRTQPIFALRDFNVTPVMIRYLFQMPTENFNFPTFRDRYRIAASAAGEDSPIAAVLSRGGVVPIVDTAEAGRKLYSSCRIATVLSLVGTVLGMLTLFLLCRTGAFDTATAGNALSYMLLWSLPVLFLAIGQNR